MKEMLERIYSLMKEAQRKTQYKLSLDQALTLIQGVAGFAGSIVEKEPFVSLDMTVSYAQQQVNWPCLTKLKSMIKSVQKWMTFGKYSPLADSSDLNFYKVNVSSVPQIMQVITLL